jgi:predicted O-methyltransferase YrrM
MYLVIDKVRGGGYILSDNVLWSGKVLEEQKDKDTMNIHLFNEKLEERSAYPECHHTHP